MSYEVTTNTKRYWAIGDRDFIEQIDSTPTFEIKRWCSVDEETLRKLHAAIGQCLTDLAHERGVNVLAVAGFEAAGPDDKPF